MSDQEYIQPSDFLENLGCSQAAWERETHAAVDRSHMWERLEPLLAHTIYMVGDRGNSAQEVLSAFDDRIRRIYELYHRDNDPDNVPISDFEIRPLEGVTVLHLVFDRASEVGHGKMDQSVLDRHLGAITQACEQNNNRGIIKVDFTDEETRELGDGKRRYSSLSLVAGELAEESGKPIVLIIDGYGQKAAKQWGFQMDDQLFQQYSEVGTIIIRSNTDQSSEDRRYGSAWASKAGWITNQAGHESYVDNTTNKQSVEFDSSRFVAFAQALNEVVGRVERGEKVCLQAPNNFGKSTALQMLRRLPKTGIRGDIALTEIHHEWFMDDYRESQTVSAENLRADGITTLIVNEAGRLQEPDSKVGKVIAGVEEAGINIVRIYPGNVTPPEGYEVVRIG